MPIVSQGLLVGFATSYAYRFRFPSKQTSNKQEWHADIAHSDRPARPPKWCSRCSRYVYTQVAAVYLALVLSLTLTDQEDRRDHDNCLWRHLWVVWHRCCLLRRHNYCTLLLLVCPSSACRRSFSDQLTWPTSRCLTRRLRTDTVGGGRGRQDVVISVSELLEIAVQVIENEKIIPFQPKNHVWIAREVEVLESIRYFSNCMFWNFIWVHNIVIVDAVQCAILKV